MTRREWLAGSVGALGLAQGRSKPNVVFVLADDLGIGDLGCYGQKEIATPNIDALGAAGTRFTSAYAGSTVCAPSRCALMTGYHTGHGRVRGNGKNELVLRKEDVVIPEVLKGAGYRTGMFGKWALGALGTAGYPTKKGWEEWFGFYSQTHAHKYYPEALLHNDTLVELVGNTGTRRRDYAPDVIHGQAMKWLDGQRAGQPFFLYYTSVIPHTNNELGRDTGNGQEVPEDAPYGGKNWPQVERNFAAMVSRLDRQVGQLVDKLKEKGLYENTLIVFTSDNGAHEEGGHKHAFFDSNGPLKGIKRSLTEGGIRVPAIAAWAGRIPAGTVNDTPWAFWDVMPTLAGVAGASAPKGIDGMDVMEVWQGKAKKTHPYYYWEFHEGGFAQAVRKGDWKCIREKTGEVRLFDLSQDLGEQTDLAARKPEVVRELTGLFEKARVESADWPRPKA
ncbi:MAG: arylsulfatase [Acidobacteriota bacterium]